MTTAHPGRDEPISISQLKAIAAEFVARDTKVERIVFAAIAGFHGTVAADQQFGAEKNADHDDALNHDTPNLDPDQAKKLRDNKGSFLSHKSFAVILG